MNIRSLRGLFPLILLVSFMLLFSPNAQATAISYGSYIYEEHIVNLWDPSFYTEKIGEVSYFVPYTYSDYNSSNGKATAGFSYTEAYSNGAGYLYAQSIGTHDEYYLLSGKGYITYERHYEFDAYLSTSSYGEFAKIHADSDYHWGPAFEYYMVNTTNLPMLENYHFAGTDYITRYLDGSEYVRFGSGFLIESSVISLTSVPEPSTLMMLVGGILFFVLMRIKMRER